MRKLSACYTENRTDISARLRVGESFDINERRLSVSGSEVAFYYIDGFVKDGEMLKIMQSLLGEKTLKKPAELISVMPFVEVEITDDADRIICEVLSGTAAVIGESFGASALLINSRTYPARPTEEPDSDRVMQGAHDGFVETLIINTALIRRRIRDERLTMAHFSLGGVSKTDVVVCYMNGVANPDVVEEITRKLKTVKPKSLTLGFQSLAETLIRRKWYNPFPKIRTTERPDTAAAQLAEGSVLVICDTSPQVMILPTSIFHYIEQTDDYYFPPLTGTYLRIVRTLILLASVVVTPLWYLYLEYADVLSPRLLFLVPEDAGALPIILQLFLVEVAIDGLKIASMNTPDMLSNSLSIVGALILGDFAVGVGWLCGDVILYMAFVAIANFAQQNHELGYAFKFMRVMILSLVYVLGIWGLGILGFVIGIILFLVFVATNKTLLGRFYLYPLIPFNAAAFKKLLIRERKKDFEDEGDLSK